MRAVIVAMLLSCGVARAERGALVSSHSGRCLGGQEAPVAVPCEGAGELTLDHQPDGTFLVVHDRTRACLFSNRDGRFGWYACTPSYRDQHWTWAGSQLRAAHSGQCLFAEADGRVGVRRCNDERAEQRWRIAPAVRARPVAGVSLVGDWEWMDGVRAAVHADGTFVLANDGGGNWRALGGDELEMRWGSGRVDRVRLSADGATLTGFGVLGDQQQRVTARRYVAPQPSPPPPARSGDAYACTTAADCVIFCPSAPSCCGSPCGCTNAMRRDHTAQYEAEFTRSCQKPPRCPAMDCQRKEAGFADCQNGRCVPAMIH